MHTPWGELWDKIRPHLTLRPIEGNLPLSTFQYDTGNTSAPYRYAHASDFLRVEFLQREGGVYADMDTLFVRPLPSTLFDHPFVMGRETVDAAASGAGAGGSLCNALFMAEPGSAFGAMWLREMQSNFDGSWSRHSTFLPFELSLRHPDLIHVEPESSFFFLDWTANGVAAIFERFEQLPSSVYSLHLWAHLWWDRGRKDVSRFHAGRLTADYVAHANTTYAHYARTLLPSSSSHTSPALYTLHSTADRLGDAALHLASRARRRLRSSWKRMA